MAMVSLFMRTLLALPDGALGGSAGFLALFGRLYFVKFAPAWNRNRCRLPHSRLRHRAGDSASGKAGSKSEAHYRTKAVGGCDPGKIEAGYRRLKSGR